MEPEKTIDLFHNLPRPWLQDFATRVLGDRVARRTLEYGTRVHAPIWSILGAPGTGKTHLVAFLVNCLNVGGNKASAATASNIAATELCRRVYRLMGAHGHKFLVVRPFSNWTEVKKVAGFITSGHTLEDWQNNPLYSSQKIGDALDNSAWAPEHSLTENALKLLRKIPHEATTLGSVVSRTGGLSDC